MRRDGYIISMKTCDDTFYLVKEPWLGRGVWSKDESDALFFEYQDWGFWSSGFGIGDARKIADLCHKRNPWAIHVHVKPVYQSVTYRPSV